MLKMINRANKSEFYYKTLNDMVGKKNKFSYMGATKSFQASVVPINAKSSPQLPKLSGKVQKNEIFEEEVEEMDILEKALDSHAKKYESQDKELVLVREKE